MRVTLINVQVSEGNNIVPPLGVLYVAAALEEAGFEVQALDLDPEVESRLGAIQDFDPDLVGMSFYTNTYPRARRLAADLRGALPQARIVCGGVHATALPEATMRELAPDYLVWGEGERTAVHLAHYLAGEGAASPAEIPGLYYWEGDRIQGTGSGEPIQDLDALPFPARHLLDFRPYLAPPGMIRGVVLDRVTTIFTSRGCPYPCIYCASRVVQGKRVRRRSPENVVAELEKLVADYGIRGFYICDDLAAGDREWMLAFSRELADRGLGLQWACQSRVDQVDAEMLAAMREAGCIQVDYGVESGAERTLKTMGKRARVGDALQAFRLTHRQGLRSLATFILGFPEETEADMEETFRLARELKASYTAFYFLTPYPGTPIYHTAVENGWVDPDHIAPERFSHRQSELPVMAIEHSPERLTRIRRRFQNRFFFRNYASWRNIGFYLSLLGALLRQPAATGRCLARFSRTLRLDDLAESLFELHQRARRVGP